MTNDCRTASTCRRRRLHWRHMELTFPVATFTGWTCGKIRLLASLCRVTELQALQSSTFRMTATTTFFKSCWKFRWTSGPHGKTKRLGGHFSLGDHPRHCAEGCRGTGSRWRHCCLQRSVETSFASRRTIIDNYFNTFVHDPFSAYNPICPTALL